MAAKCKGSLTNVLSEQTRASSNGDLQRAEATAGEQRIGCTQ